MVWWEIYVINKPDLAKKTKIELVLGKQIAMRKGVIYEEPVQYKKNK